MYLCQINQRLTQSSRYDFAVELQTKRVTFFKEWTRHSNQTAFAKSI